MGKRCRRPALESPWSTGPGFVPRSHGAYAVAPAGAEASLRSVLPAVVNASPAAVRAARPPLWLRTPGVRLRCMSWRRAV